MQRVHGIEELTLFKDAHFDLWLILRFFNGIDRGSKLSENEKGKEYSKDNTEGKEQYWRIHTQWWEDLLQIFNN